MKRKLTYLFTTLLVSSFALAQAASPARNTTTAASTATPAAPSATAPTRVGVIDIQAAIINTNEGRRDFEALAKKFDPKRSEITSLSEDIENLKKQLAAQQDKLNDEERGNRVRAIDQKTKNLQRVGEDAQTEFNTQRDDLVSRIGSKMIEVLRKYAETNNLAVVIDASNQGGGVLWASEQVNITPAIVNAYNAQSNVPAQAAPSAARPATRPSSLSTPRKPATGSTTPPK